MSDQKSNNALKILTGVLAVALVALGIYTIKFYNDEKENQELLQQEKAVIEGELNDLIVKYDEAIAENEGLDSELSAARGRIVALRDSVQDMEANLALISRYRREVSNLKAEKEQLFRVVDSLSNQNQRLITEIDSTNNMLLERTRISDSLQVQTQTMASQIDRAAQLKVSNLRGEGVIERNSGRLVENDRTRRVDKIRTCFTITPNSLASSGDKELYVQVYNPNNELVGDQIAVQHEGGVMVYSASTNVFYENEELDVCLLANTNSDRLIEGSYKVLVYEGTNLIGATGFSLR
jgi:predicted RNase H-like nuclease (RuvC/YqgF family)